MHVTKSALSQRSMLTCQVDSREYHVSGFDASIKTSGTSGSELPAQMKLALAESNPLPVHCPLH